MGFDRKIFIGIMFVMAAGVLAASENNSLQITVLVYNHAKVKQSVLAAAERKGGAILGAAGAGAHWVDCSSGMSAKQICHRALEPREFVLHIVQGRGATDSVFGVAFLAEDGVGQYADVFFNRIEEMLKESEMDPSSLLATVIVHELGHLLLGSNAHTPFGIMAPRWRQEELRQVNMGRLWFSSEQVARMRTRILGMQESPHGQVATLEGTY